MKELPDKSVDLIICDLPYGCLIPNSCSWDVKINLEAFWKEIKRIRKNDHTPCIHFCTTKFGYELVQSNPAEFRYDLVWDKKLGVSFLSANKMPLRSHEMIYIFSKAGAFYQRTDIPGDFKEWKRARSKNGIKHYGTPQVNELVGGDGKRCVKSIISITKTVSQSKHPTEKPEELYRWLIERYCPTGGLVLDPTFGSGNSLFTAYAMGRNAVGMEMDDGFFAKAEERLNKL
jgi:site-specific DNA-methyltransferase (adenine-specific)